MNTRTIQLSIALFNAVPKGKPQKSDLRQTLEYGIIVDQHAAYALPVILDYFKQNKLTSEQLNSTFHKSWQVIKESSREELFIHQILHYFTTYGTNFTSDYVYFPAEKLELPNIEKIQIKVIRGLEPSVLIQKSMRMLSSGIALDEKTIDNLLDLLTQLGYNFDNIDQIKNKEALVKIVDETGVLPSHPSDFLRYLIYLGTDSTLLIKNKETIEAIKRVKIDFSEEINAFGLKKCAEIFNRFKPLWLAFKSHPANIPLINEISRLSKKHHRPLPEDVLNSITSTVYSEEQVKAALQRANNFRKIRLLNALNTRLNEADTFLYRIRNGKSFSKKMDTSKKRDYYQKIFKIIYQNLVDNLSLNGLRIRYPKNVDYALPSTEKMFVGNFPTGTKITAENLVSGVYWENTWGANDLDLSALNLSGKIGWNSEYKSEGLLYSGDITDAPEGATELLYTKGNLPHPSLSILNIYSGVEGCKFKIIVGAASEIKANYMFNPNELILEAEANMVGRQQILGIFLPETNNKISFILVNAGFGSMSVSSNFAHSNNARDALYYQYASPLSFRKLLVDAGAIIVDDGEANIDLTPQNLDKGVFIKMLSGVLKHKQT